MKYRNILFRLIFFNCLFKISLEYYFIYRLMRVLQFFFGTPIIEWVAAQLKKQNNAASLLVILGKNGESVILFKKGLYFQLLKLIRRLFKKAFFFHIFSNKILQLNYYDSIRFFEF
jgi:hypothetical protein